MLVHEPQIDAQDGQRTQPTDCQEHDEGCTELIDGRLSHARRPIVQHDAREGPQVGGSADQQRVHDRREQPPPLAAELRQHVHAL
jgi:hypothetical protein